MPRLQVFVAGFEAPQRQEPAAESVITALAYRCYVIPKPKHPSYPSGSSLAERCKL